ncbi:hypothetical protein ACVWY1_000079 [Pseudomonas sp. TE6288]|uniref:fimbrial protein n=1 Tax=unclassified Pseudomonas TaxID=196821 RepID=UPI000C886D10|nr:MULTISPECIES: fimbrial protein [unclassified Pseudomonas]PNA02132.1 pilus assembly protein [Pseudomonas sp. FW305-42]PNA23050.1 pilus assembly protein [Pseudomonas sp. MPR-R1B]PNB28389.1 pilus assembly protein [Pseudomonas sp. DP16D-E2]PNB44742.1 pilus assembly protein [Pseudomonas sp. FW305-17]PNB64191.1 pilus assembly protein [Pseudomonas sp. GW531-E2]
MNRLYRALLALLLLALALSGKAADNVQFSGNLIATPLCTLSDKGGRIDVRFQRNIAINRIDGHEYRQPIPYQLDCPGAAGSGIAWRMRLTLVGDPTAFDPAALQTSIPDLGIKVLLDGADLVVGISRPLQVSNGSPLPLLEAVPVKRRDAVLQSKDFTASALLLAELY